jgi:H+/Cl- antiporter ClcA
MLVCSFILPIFLLHKKLGRNKWVLLVIGFLSTFGLTFVLFVILLSNLHQEFLSSSTKSYLSYLFFRPLIMTGLLVGIDLIIQKLRNDKKELSTQDILDQE